MGTHRGASSAFRDIRSRGRDGVDKPMQRIGLTLTRGARSVLRRSAKRILARVRHIKELARGRVRFGVGVRPLSECWGFDRGLPVHRHYLERFLGEFSADIHGHCLEFQDNGYTRRFGGSAVAVSDVLHIDDSNRAATIVADLTKPNDIASDRFDCIICTHVLHIIPGLERAINELYRILKPGGSLLVAVPHVSMCEPDFGELWRFTPQGLHSLLARAFRPENVTIRPYGNSLTAAAEIRGITAYELTQAELNHHDPRFAVEVCARAIKR
jgi:hypothetical protein